MTRLSWRRGALLCAALWAPDVLGADWYVAPGGTGNGTTSGTPFGTIAEGLNAAMPGDTVHLAAGAYNQAITTVRAGAAASPITVRSTVARMATVSVSGRVLTVNHPYVVFEGLVFDGQYGADDAIRLSSAATGTRLRNCEVRRSGRDCVDMLSPSDVTIEGSLIHHCLNFTGGARVDAHGVVAGAARNLTLRDTEIHSFSGDGLQLDPDRLAPGWDNLLIERCHIWLGPLPQAENGYAAGVVPGENAVDTKVRFDAGYRPRLVVRDTVAHGFKGGLITNMAAYNLKENVDALLDRVTVYDSEIAFRTRGPQGGIGGAHVDVRNAVVYAGTTGVRYEDNIDQLSLGYVTFGGGLTQSFQRASSPMTTAAVTNGLFLSGSLPAEANGTSNRAVGASVFVNAAAHDYHLASGSSPIDQGVAIPGVSSDRDGVVRPQGAQVDVGAYEWCQACRPDGGAGGGSGGGGGGSGGAGAGGGAGSGGAGASGGGGSGGAGAGAAGGSAGAGGAADGGNAGASGGAGGQAGATGGGDATGAGCGCAATPWTYGIALAVVALRRRKRRSPGGCSP